PSVPRRRGAHRPAHAPPTRPMRTATPLFVGVDAGGTKTALRAEAGETASVRTGPGVNVRRAGPERAVEVLAGLVESVLEDHPNAPLGGLAAGLAGAGEETDRR